jgi:hypothetical protein
MMLHCRRNRKAGRNLPTGPKDPAVAVPAGTSVPAANFLRAIIAEDNRSGKYGGRVVTRFRRSPTDTCITGTRSRSS